MKKIIKLCIYKNCENEVREYAEDIILLKDGWKKIGMREIEVEDGVEETITVNKLQLCRLITAWITHSREDGFLPFNCAEYDADYIFQTFKHESGR